MRTSHILFEMRSNLFVKPLAHPAGIIVVMEDATSLCGTVNVFEDELQVVRDIGRSSDGDERVECRLESERRQTFSRSFRVPKIIRIIIATAA